MKISIITVCYNEVEEIRNTIESVIGQTYSNIEYIVIDGASNDGTVEILKEYQGQIDVLISEPDKGIYNAMNNGIQHASGEYICFINGGDELYSKDTISLIIDNLNVQSEIIYGDISNKERTQTIGKYSDFKLTQFVNGTIPHPGTFIKSTLFQNRIFSEELRIASDYLFFIESAIVYNSSFQYIGFETACFDLTGVSSTNHIQLNAERTIIQRKYQHIFDALIILKGKEESVKIANSSKVLKLLKYFLPRRYHHILVQ